jgi:hypothetical protein
VKHFKDGNTDIADQPRCGRQRTAATERNKQKVDELIRQDREIAVQLGVSGAPCSPGDDGDFGISESFFPLGSSFVYWYRGTQNGWELLFHPPYSLDLAPSDYHLFRPLKDHLRESRKPCEAGCVELERTSTAEAYLRFCNVGRNTQIGMKIL